MLDRLQLKARTLPLYPEWIQGTDSGVPNQLESLRPPLKWLAERDGLSLISGHYGSLIGIVGSLNRSVAAWPSHWA